MCIAEVYASVQGEGGLTGTSSVFVRTSGCNLRCWFCDTPFASWQPQGDDLDVGEVLRRVAEWESRHVVVTGGEPMLFAELIPLCAGLRDRGYHITIETAGTLYLPVDCDLMSISPKFASSAPPLDDNPTWYRRHQRTRHAPDVIRSLVDEYTYQIKFVIDTPADCEEVEHFLAGFPEIVRKEVLLMPQGQVAEQLDRVADWLQPYCESHELQYCPRKQIEWFGLVRGT